MHHLIPRPGRLLLVVGSLLGLALCAPTLSADEVSMNTMKQRVQPCMACHAGKGIDLQSGFVPGLHGKPAGYLFNQLMNYRSGRRHHRAMEYMVRNLSPDYLQEIADHFAGLEGEHPQPADAPTSAALRERADELISRGDPSRDMPACIACHGEYLARAANCMGCHTARGGEDFAGGHRLGTDFGTFFTPNITPDVDTGIGDWTRQEFHDAMRHGRRPGGSALYPACPYTSFTQMSDEDIDAVHSYLASRPAVQNENRAHNLSFPASFRPLQHAWQRVYFDAGEFESDPERSDSWNRGAFLVRGPAHCMACHAERHRFGSTRAESARGDHVQGWYAPSLYSSAEAGLQDWPEDDAVRLLRAGKSEDAAVIGPMANVVHDSLQHLTGDDIRAMVHYLQSLPDHEPEPARHQAGTRPA